MEYSRRDVMKLAAGSLVAATTGRRAGRVLGQFVPPVRVTAPRVRPHAAPVPGPYRTAPGLLPPKITVTTAAQDTAPGWIVLTPSPGTDFQGGLMLADNRGEPVWFSPRAHGPIDAASTIGVTGTSSTNMEIMTYQGRPVLTWWEGDIILPGYGNGQYFLADSSYKVIKTVKAGRGLHADLHDFYLTNRNTALVTAYDEKAADLSSVGGPAKGTLLDSLFQEIDLTTGAVLFQWRASNFVALKEAYVAPVKGQAYDFFHINSVSLAPDGHYIVSGRHTWCVYKVNRHDGSIIWRLNGKKSTFAIGAGAGFSWQHHVRALTNTELTIFDDGAGPEKTEKQSRGLKVALDMQKKTARLLEAYESQPHTLAGSQGSVQELGDGHVFVGWGAQPYFSEYRNDGTLLFDAQLPEGSHSYRTYRQPWVGQPTNPPAVAAERQGGRVTVYASWNGATEVAAWQVRVGPKANLLSPLQNFARSGFETVMTVTTDQPYVAVRALDHKGAVLGRSGAVSV